MLTAKPIFSYRPYWARRFGVAPVLPMSRAEMDQLGWDSCDIILVTGDAYVDHPSFGMAVIGRVLEAAGGDGFAVARRLDGTLMAWGDSEFGQTSVPGGAFTRIAIGCTASAGSLPALYTSNRLLPRARPPSQTAGRRRRLGARYQECLKLSLGTGRWRPFRQQPER